MKSLNVKIPLSIAQHMDENAHLNPNYLTGLIVAHMNKHDGLNKELPQLCFNYTFKIDVDLHKQIKLRAIEMDLPMNELLGRLIVKHYKG